MKQHPSVCGMIVRSAIPPSLAPFEDREALAALHAALRAEPSHPQVAERPRRCHRRAPRRMPRRHRLAPLARP